MDVRPDREFLTTIMSAPSHPPIDPDARGVRTVRFGALGTDCVIRFRMDDETAALRFLADALGWIERFEAKFSRFRPASAVSRINAAAGREWVKTDAEVEQVLDLADDMFRVTEGILDSTLLPLLRVWDWKTVHVKLPEADTVRKALDLTGWEKVRREPGRVFLPEIGMGLDFGGFGKEFAVDRLIDIARRHGICDALVDLGRDISAIGGNGLHPFWHVGVQDGIQPGEAIGGLAVSGYAVAASADHARRFEHDGIRYGHIVDPRTGWPVRHGLRAVTVLAPTCLQAGVVSTAAFVLGKTEGLRFATASPGVEACLQDDHGIERTPGFVRRQVRAA